MKNILFIESGSSGYGGSFQSLYLKFNLLSSKKYSISVIFLNKTPFYSKLIEKGISCYYVNDILYSSSNIYLKKIYWKINNFVYNYVSQLSVLSEYLLHLSTIKQIIKIGEKENINIIHLNTQISRDFFGLFVAKYLNVPCVIHLRTINSYYLNYYKLRYAKKIIVR